jgi:glycosyltransferase EpsD
VQSKNSRCRRLFRIDGVGVDLARFHPAAPAEKERLRRQYGFSQEDFILLYIAEFIPRKNHVYLIRRIPLLREAIPELKIVFAGKGETMDACKESVVAINSVDMVHFLGYRHDVEMLCQIADIHVSPSRQEGLAVSNIEAMATGLPILCSRIRGHTDVVTEGRNGFLFDLDDPDALTERIITLYRSPALRETIAAYNAEDARRFSLDNAVTQMAGIYRQFM